MYHHMKATNLWRESDEGAVQYILAKCLMIFLYMLGLSTSQIEIEQNLSILLKGIAVTQHTAIRQCSQRVCCLVSVYTYK